MKHIYLAIDDESLALSDLTNSLQEADPEGIIYAYTSPTEAISAISQGQFSPDIAFFDIQIRNWTGMQLAVELRKLLPRLEIVFVTAYPQYALESYSLHIRGYLMKPVTAQAIREELDVISGVSKDEESSNAVQVNCFGNFEVFYLGVPLRFPRSKSKELFAYLVYRKGTACSVKEIATVLFEDREYDIALKNQMETFKSDLFKTLRKINCENILLKSHNRLSIDVNKIDCDFYQLLQGNREAINSFTGEFMSQYSWAEPTAAALFCKYL